ncbi:hypothetical protein MLD38_011334 [Melastoma candidum]|uniref:Uncharacterized protein n=1 Tax=Melastoma candidum TaxID=119954 RepID=A0ACB9RB08_9MYRT|nr:hypothetical protein MLD38_011334 [Melastoma candidum]
MPDGNLRLNLDPFVTTWMEPRRSTRTTLILMSTCYQNCCVKYDRPYIQSVLGESEAVMLAGHAFKTKWQNKRKVEGKPYDKPNIMTGANVQVNHRFLLLTFHGSQLQEYARYFGVELKEVKLREGYYVMDPVKAVEMVDENIICVVATLGSTLNREFKDVKLLNDLLIETAIKQGIWDTPIHVDAASGGFINPFFYSKFKWDFWLPLVKSINVSGHKYGLVYSGICWVIWWSKEDLPEELIFHINYLRADQCTFSLNFSKAWVTKVTETLWRIAMALQWCRRTQDQLFHHCAQGWTSCTMAERLVIDITKEDPHQGDSGEPEPVPGRGRELTHQGPSGLLYQGENAHGDGSSQVPTGSPPVFAIEAGGIKPGIAISIPKRCSIWNRLMGKNCGRYTVR